MYHLAAWFEALGTTANTDIQPVADQILSIDNNHFTFNQATQLLAAYASSATLSRARIQSPQTRQVSPVYIRPPTVSLLPPTDPNIMNLVRNPFVLQPHEEVAIEATSAIAMGTENFYALAWLTWMGTRPWPVGDIFPIRFTGTTTLTANVWSDVTVTFADTLPNGQYTAVFSECQGTTQIAHRWIFDNQVPRPGFFGFATLGLRQPNPFYEGQLGVMGEFPSYSTPRLQVLANAADTAQEGYLWVIRTGPARRAA